MEMMVVECVPPALETVHTVKFMLSVCYHSEEMGGKPEVELSGGSYASTGFVRGSAPLPVPLTRLQHSLRNSHRQPLANPSQPLGSMDWTWPRHFEQPLPPAANTAPRPPIARWGSRSGTPLSQSPAPKGSHITYLGAKQGSERGDDLPQVTEAKIQIAGLPS